MAGAVRWRVALLAKPSSPILHLMYQRRQEVLILSPRERENPYLSQNVLKSSESIDCRALLQKQESFEKEPFLVCHLGFPSRPSPRKGRGLRALKLGWAVSKPWQDCPSPPRHPAVLLGWIWCSSHPAYWCALPPPAETGQPGSLEGDVLPTEMQGKGIDPCPQPMPGAGLGPSGEPGFLLSLHRAWHNAGN